MARKCGICGKKPQFGNQISHAHNVSHRRWNPNIQKIRLMLNGKPCRAYVCTDCISAGKVERPPRMARPAKAETA